MTKQLKITFCGAAGVVTGSNHLIETIGAGKDLKILLDCGLHQGCRTCEAENLESFIYDPQTVDYLLVTHAHLDHIGRIPKLVRDGFRGKIISTLPTKEIALLSLIDSLGVMAKEAHASNAPPLYTEADVRDTESLWQTINYHEPVALGEIQAVWREAGHILGSAMIELTLNGKKLVFSGDLGNSPNVLLKDCEAITDAAYLIMESTYGDRLHEGVEERERILQGLLIDTLVKRKGTVMIPAFSIERTQEILYAIEKMMEQSKIPVVPVFLDSPMGISVTEIYRNYIGFLNGTAQEFMKHGDGIFRFAQLHYTRSTDESKAIRYAPNQKIIIAGSGMSNGGRILHHEKQYLPDSKSTLLICGYQASGSLGRVIEDGARSVKIMGDDIPVNAQVKLITGYSGHKDADDLVAFVAGTVKSVERVFLVHGEEGAAEALATRLNTTYNINVSIPKLNDSVVLDF
jgi:metallo-beta-lactamase family protein